MLSESVTLTEIIEVIGESAALAVVKAYGGTTIRLPALKNCTADHPIAQVIGLSLLIKLVVATGGSRWLYVAKCERGLMEQRNREIVAAYTRGEPVIELARRNNLSDRQVWNILKCTVVDGRQGGLFDNG